MKNYYCEIAVLQFVWLTVKYTAICYPLLYGVVRLFECMFVVFRLYMDGDRRRPQTRQHLAEEDAEDCLDDEEYVGCALL